MGIASRLMGMPERVEIRLITGRNRAAAPTFCMKLEMTPTVPATIGWMRVSDAPPRCMIVAAILFMIPVLSSPAPTIITAMIEMTALEANPLNSWLTSARFARAGW